MLFMKEDTFFSEVNEWEQYRELFKKIEIPANTILLREGKIARTAYYIEKGCLRMWFNDHGKDITFQFFFENKGVSSIESFRNNQPSLFSIESIEPCTLYSISKEDFQSILEKSQAIR